ncbi:HAD family hydrolase [Candidatus Woesearchaeota archaeon]|nr:HAD family hydrolase [Candidatus Woesearchaeota archaeon]
MKLFIFDWSGVISDDRRPVYEANMKIFRENGIRGLSLEEFFLKTDSNIAEFLAKQGVVGTPEELSLLGKRAYDLVINSGIQPVLYGDVRNTLDFLSKRNKMLAVLSSHPEANLKQEARDYGIDHYFRLIIGGSRDKSDGIIRIVEAIGIQREETVYLGDMVFDIRAAKIAGVKSGAVAGTIENQRGYHSRKRLEEGLPDFVLTTLDDLKWIV